MSLAALAFAAGAALLQLQAALPSLAWAAVVPLLALGAWRYRILMPAAAFAAEIQRGRDEMVRDFAVKMLPGVKMHQKLAQEGKTMKSQ